MTVKRESKSLFCYGLEQTRGELEVNKLFYKIRMSELSGEKLKLY